MHAIAVADAITSSVTVQGDGLGDSAKQWVGTIFQRPVSTPQTSRGKMEENVNFQPYRTFAIKLGGPKVCLKRAGA